jgi:glycosyltransferase involved in cell wall biosynthesis
MRKVEVGTIMNRSVCFVGSEITPSEGSTFVGGHVNTVVGLCKGLADLGWEVHIVTTPSRFLKNMEFSFPWAKFHLVHASGRHNSVGYNIDYLMKAVSTVKVLHSRENFCLVHAHSGYFGPSIIPILARMRLDITALFSLYCPASLLPNKLPLDSYGIRVLSSGLDKIIAVTENVKESLIKCGVSPWKIEVLHSCFDEKAFSSLAHSRKNHKGSKIRKVLFVGNADKTKGLDIFLDAARFVSRKNPNVKFIVPIHESYERLESVRVLASQRLGSSVKVLGVVRNIAQLIASVDLVVAPFRSTEGISDIPIIVLEAMALGKPVIASNLEGVKEAIQHGKNGIIVNHNDPVELANAITNLLDNPTFSEEIGNRAIVCAKKFSHSEISKRLSDLYLKVMEIA